MPFSVGVSCGGRGEILRAIIALAKPFYNGRWRRILKIQEGSMKKYFVSIVVFIFLLPVYVLAGEYVLVKGEGTEVCEAYKKNLNLFKPRVPMEYRKLNPQMGDFSKPTWVHLDDIRNRIPRDSNLDLHISKFLWDRDVNPAKYFRDDLSKWRGTKKQLADAYKLFLVLRHEISRWKVPNNHLIAEIDIDNDGVLEPVYLDSMYGDPTLLLVLKNDYSDIDYEKTKLVMMHPSRKDLGLGYFKPVQKDDRGIPPDYIKRDYVAVDDALRGSLYGIFLFRDKTYFDLWGFPDGYDAPGWHSPFDNYLRVFISENRKTNEICKYKFVYTSDK